MLTFGVHDMDLLWRENRGEKVESFIQYRLTCVMGSFNIAYVSWLNTCVWGSWITWSIWFLDIPIFLPWAIMENWLKSWTFHQKILVVQNIKQLFIFTRLNRQKKYLRKHMINFDRCWFQILIVKIWETNEISQK